MTQVLSVRLQAGATLGELQKEELKHGFHFPCNIIVGDPTWGGAVATGSHVRYNTNILYIIIPFIFSE